ncbi:MAG TPA: response regulator [Candidatus Limnocylindria bacterium]|nr:response regulator [Candidatus Limnocylindria bacterium]
MLPVEDNPDDEALTLRAFQKNNLGNPIVVKRDGAEALAWLFSAEREIEPQLVLLDLKLPKVDGLEVLRQLRADPRTSLLPVVILTSSKEQSDLVKGYELRANSYIRKPVDFAHFVEAAREIGLYWMVLNESPPTHVENGR